MCINNNSFSTGNIIFMIHTVAMLSGKPVVGHLSANLEDRE